MRVRFAAVVVSCDPAGGKLCISAGETSIDPRLQLVVLTLFRRVSQWHLWRSDALTRCDLSHSMTSVNHVRPFYRIPADVHRRCDPSVICL